MNDYVIYTDSACDVSTEVLNGWGVCSTPLTFRFDGEEREYTNETMTTAEFYQKMRSGSVARTAAVNVAAFEADFEKLLRQGKDILYMGISSTFSGTYQSAVIAGEQLKEKYPEHKILTVDSLGACSGEALLVYLTVEKKKAGATIEEAAAFADEIRHKICQWVTVDDLIYLKRGGRLSSKEMLVGKALGIKPLLRVTAEGRLVGAGKVRGRKKALQALADKYSEVAENADQGRFFVFHSECREAAEELVEMLKEKHQNIKAMISDINAVIGTHVGPGALYCAFVGTER